MEKASGYIFLDGKETQETRQCVHCGRHWIYERGSGRKYGFCMNCMGIHCATEECCICIPWQKKMDLIEKGRLDIL